MRALAVASVLGLGGLVGMCYLFKASWGIGAATTGLLTALWQVQAGSVSLALALAVFVFGLLPQTRGRVTYREFLRRSGALPIVALGVGSLVLDGLVLLGIGHQVPASSPTASDGHGLAVTVATMLGLASIASIGVLFALTIKAIDPATARSAQATFRANVLGQAVRSELQEAAAIGLMEQQLGGTQPTFRMDTLVQGRRIETDRTGRAVVHDVSLWRLAVLRWYEVRRGHQAPVIHCWPGKRLPPGGGRILLTIDARSWLPVRWWARWCVRVRTAGPERFIQALDALHAETLEAIRADRPVEALEGIEATGDLLDAVWRAYRAHARHYDREAEQAYWLIVDHPAALEITIRLRTQTRSAVVSRDEELRVKAAAQPRLIARRALQAHAGASVTAMLEMYEELYGAVVDDLLERGAPWPPADGVARRRINMTTAPLLALVLADVRNLLSRALDIDYANTAPERWRASLTAARDLVTQMNEINEGVLGLLRRAIDLQDTPTLTQLLPHWRPPVVAQTSIYFGQASNHGRAKAPEIGVLQGDIVKAVEGMEVQLDAMRLRLLTAAVHQDWESAQPATATPPPSPPQTGLPQCQSPAAAADSRSTMVDEVLFTLPATRVWRILPVAFDQAKRRDWYHRRHDNELVVTGVVVTGERQPVASLREVFILTLLLRPDLIDTTDPDPDFILENADGLRTAARAAVEQRTAWLQRYGVDPQQARERSRKIVDMVTRIQEEALDARAASVIETPVNPEHQARLQTEARTNFTRFDVFGKLLTWAGNPPAYGTDPDGTQAPLASTSGLIRRENLIAADTADLSSLGTDLGQNLAERLVQAFLVEVNQATTPEDIGDGDVGSTIEAAIDELRNAHTSTAKIVVMIPIWTQLRETLTLTAAEWRHPTASSGMEGDQQRRDMLSQLGLNDPQTEWHLAGLLGETPVIQVGGLARQAVIVDLARFARFHPAPSNTAQAVDPLLTVEEPDRDEVTVALASQLDALARTGGLPPLEPSERERQLKTGVRNTMLHVQIDFTAHGHLTVDDPSAARVLNTPNIQ